MIYNEEKPHLSCWVRLFVFGESFLVYENLSCIEKNIVVYLLTKNHIKESDGV